MDVADRAPAIAGLHHVTAITGELASHVAFYTRVLGLRLVKKTVNQDDVRAYHLFYGDERGAPGTEVTFFYWPQAPRNVHGAGGIARISLAVADAAALPWWVHRFDEAGVAHGDVVTRAGRSSLAFADTEGQRLELVAAGAPDRLPGQPWSRSPVPAEVAIRGLHGVTLRVADAAPTLAALTHLMGLSLVASDEREDGTTVSFLAAGDGHPGAEVRVVAGAADRRAMPGVGGVHHVAFRTAGEDEQRVWQGRVEAAGLRHSGIVDRFYFKSLYFREPGHILFEIATDGPGFATDEPLEHLGERLALPPFLEPHRAEIEPLLPPLPTPAAGGA